MTRQGFFWSVAAMLGIVCAAAIAWSTSLLAGQHIGLSSVPLSAAGHLAPAAARTEPNAGTRHLNHGGRVSHRTVSVPPRQTATFPTVSTVAPVPAASSGPAPATVPVSPSPTNSGAAAAAAPAPARPREDSSQSAAAGSAQPHSGSSDKRDD